MKQYDYLIVGAGLYGAVFAHEAKKAGKRCLVIDKRDHIAGNIYTEPVEGINVHRYGAHIFHTNNKAVWQYVNQFAEFNRYTNSPVANYHGEIYNMPFNMNTFNKMWGVVTPAEAKAKIEQQKAEAGITEPKNLEEQAISLVGTDIYEKLVKGYTGKQWGRPCTELPAFIIKRLPVRFTYDNNYFNALYQGIPNGGYTAMVEKMLDGVEVRLNVDYLAEKEQLDKLADKVVYTGPVDAYFGYQLSTSTSSSAPSPKRSSAGSTAPSGRRATSRIIPSMTRRTVPSTPSTRSWPTPNRGSSSAAVWASTSTTTWIRSSKWLCPWQRKNWRKLTEALNCCILKP